MDGRPFDSVFMDECTNAPMPTKKAGNAGLFVGASRTYFFRLPPARLKMASAC